MTRWIKAKAPGGALEFFTYSELVYWFVFTIAVNPIRWKWARFVLFGVGKGLPLGVARHEDRAREGEWRGEVGQGQVIRMSEAKGVGE